MLHNPILIGPQVYEPDIFIEADPPVGGVSGPDAVEPPGVSLVASEDAAVARAECHFWNKS